MGNASAGAQVAAALRQLKTGNFGGQAKNHNSSEVKESEEKNRIFKRIVSL